ncbi:restriction endonuclease subunit S [Tannockella kyphosi]|uniref:restriction endonuclease subunit S n=1 Tax=Tannockella kyphosi TaxID=2899121 RepID=UPI00201351BB|nr:restriction endonuclease subunit S [Tannockella kyphosi]
MSSEKWQMVKLGDVCTKGGSNIAKKDLENSNGEYPIYGAGGLIKTVEFYKQSKPYIAIVKDGAGVGRTMILPEKSSVIGTMQYIFPNDNIDIRYLFYAILKMNLSKYFSGATIPHIYFKDYRNENVWLPPIKVQKQIADELDKITGLIEKRKEQLEKLDVLVKSRFIEMFGDPVMNPKRWEINNLGDLGELNRGVSKQRPRNDPQLLNGAYPLIQTGEVANAKLYVSRYTKTYSELGVKQSKMWNEGTLCITVAANIAKTAIIKFDACFPDSIVGFEAGEKTGEIFIHYWFSFFQEILETKAPESAQKNINLEILKELEVIVPPLKLQNLFTTYVAKTVELKEEVSKSLENLEMLKKERMQYYFE